MKKIAAAEETMYDDEELAFLEELKPYRLIDALFSYTKDLEEMVLELRKEVNGLTPGKCKPYEDLYSDFYETFDDYPAYQRYKYLFESE
jgi:hypothetical protein